MLTRKNGGALAVLLGSGWFGDDRATVLERPNCVMIFRNGRAECSDDGTGTGDPLRLLEEKTGEGYLGIGFFGYEFFHHLQRDFRARRKDPGIFPDACFAFFEEGSLKRLPAGEFLNGADNPAPKSFSLEKTIDHERFMEMVEAVRRYILAGDVYQVNLSQMFEIEHEPDPVEFLKTLYSAQPVPFACCMDFGAFGVISGSMELFLRRSGRTITSGPIKGTRPRLADRAEDERVIEELRSDEKERAENLMIVDLMRNDLGRICEFGSVRVPHLFRVETYSTLHQLVSYVSGRLRDDVTIGDVIRATFPPGSVTGAPKRRALEIIEELEPHRRGPYCGAICLFLPDGDFVMSVGIRVVGVGGGKSYFWSGGGITWGSTPEKEYAETLVKARAVAMALGGTPA
ncbi:MAG: anthranilate synthase component I family protein [Candidatus Hadarchaeales archaeon]